LAQKNNLSYLITSLKKKIARTKQTACKQLAPKDACKSAPLTDDVNKLHRYRTRTVALRKIHQKKY
jgi:hypothetical protein